MKRRSFLSLVGIGAAAAAVTANVPRQFLDAAERVQRCYRQVLPFSPELGFTEICPPGGIVSLVAIPQRIFRPDRLMFQGNPDLERFTLIPLEEEDEPLLATLLQPVPATLFAEVAFGVRIPFGVAYPGEEVVLRLQNHSSQDAEISAAAMVGDALR